MPLTVLIVLSVYMYVICFFGDGLLAVRIFDSSLGSFGQSCPFLQTTLPAIFSRYWPTEVEKGNHMIATSLSHPSRSITVMI